MAGMILLHEGVGRGEKKVGRGLAMRNISAMDP